jgi:hypothetical protein
LGDLSPTERRERAVHGAFLVPVFAVANPHLALIGLLLGRCELAEEVALALLFDGGAKLDVAARGVCAVLEHLHRALASG